MELALLAAGCIVAPLLFISGFVFLGDAVGKVVGHSSLGKLYATFANCPANTESSFFAIGLLGNGLGHTGSDAVGLYVHPGMIGEAIYVPWHALRPIMRIAWYIVLREQQTGIWIVVPRRVLGPRPTPWQP